MNTGCRQEIVAKGLAFLERRQLESGQFPVEVTFHYLEGSPVQPDEALFATALIVYSLGFLPHTVAQTMINRALTYFQTEMSGRGLWRYWGKNAERDGHKLHRFIPADLDDMANISYLLKRHGKRFPDNQRIMCLNRDRNGLFYTWLVPRPVLTLSPSYWRCVLLDINLARMTVFWKTTEARYNDVDAVVNANALLYLGVCGANRPIIEWLERIVRDGNEAVCDKWYRDPYTFYYALSRNHHRGVASFSEVIEVILSRITAGIGLDGRIGDHVLQTALAVNSTLNLGESPAYLTAAVDYIAEMQRDDGSWESHPLYYGGPRCATSWGSKELTTGLCLEALARSSDLAGS
jgi:hypothetical protein